MNRPSTANGKPPAGTDANAAVLEDLRTRLQSSRTQELAARAEARRVARELALVLRLLKFSVEGPPPPRIVEAAEIGRLSATLLTSRMTYHLDACENHGTHTTVSGWAFCPVEGWDARIATVTVLLRHGDTAYVAAAGCVHRPDVAAHYATQPAEDGGGARGLEGSGFACEILNDSLPAGIEMKLGLRLECEGMACEQSTGQRLRL